MENRTDEVVIIGDDQMAQRAKKSITGQLHFLSEFVAFEDEVARMVYRGQKLDKKIVIICEWERGGQELLAFLRRRKLQIPVVFVCSEFVSEQTRYFRSGFPAVTLSDLFDAQYMAVMISHARMNAGLLELGRLSRLEQGG